MTDLVIHKTALGLTEEHKRRISEGLKRSYREGRMKSWNKGLTKFSNSSVRKIAERVAGHVPWNKGQKGIYDEEVLKRISEARIKFFQKHPEARLIGNRNPARRPEVREKMSKARKGKKLSDETRKKIGDFSRGKELSEEVKKHMSLAQRKRYLDPKERAKFEKTRNPFYGKRHRPETIENMKRKLSLLMSGQNNPLYGRSIVDIWVQKYGLEEAIRRNDERKRKLSELELGENNPNWRGGLSYQEYGREFRPFIKHLIRRRDDYACQICGRNHCQLDVHHIDYDKKNNNSSNLVTLCKSCHGDTNNDREYWSKVLRDRVGQREVLAIS